MKVSVVICTRDRAASLERTLSSLAACRVPSGLAWEVIVVDNASTDDTGRVARGFGARLPLTVIEESMPGLSHARNRAVDAATGDYVLWTDDDVDLSPGWLAEYVDAFVTWPSAGVYGGPIRPLFEAPPPRWLAESLPILGGPFTLRDCGDAPGPLSVAADRIPFGANHAIAIVDQRRQRYDPSLGVGASRRRNSEETEVIRAILGSGRAGRWLPHAWVHHRIPASRMTRRYIATWFRAAGETDAYLNRHRAARRISGVPAWLFRSLPIRYGRYRLARLTAPPAVWVRRFAEYEMDRGALTYWLDRSDGR